jgi:hypothetical protein
VACPASPDLLICLRFEGNAADGSPHAVPTTPMGLRFEAGQDGLALSSGSATSVRVGPSSQPDVQRYTIEAWIKPRTLPGQGSRAGVLDNEGQFSIFIYPNGTLRCSGVGDVFATGAVSAGSWTHLACVNDGANLTAYVNGVARAATRTGAVDSSGQQTILVGQNNVSPGSPNPDPFDGLIDNVRVWRRALSPSELCTKPDCRP